MVPFLITISFILHLITLLTVVILFQRLKLQDQPTISEYEQMFQQYLSEIKDENFALQTQLEQIKGQKQVENEQVIHGESKETRTFDPPIDLQENAQDNVETSLTANILSLADEGYSANEIAQQLKCGKTEVELIIKFYAQKKS